MKTKNPSEHQQTLKSPCYYSHGIYIRDLCFLFLSSLVHGVGRICIIIHMFLFFVVFIIHKFTDYVSLQLSEISFPSLQINVSMKFRKNIEAKFKKEKKIQIEHVSLACQSTCQLLLFALFFYRLGRWFCSQS